jgi:hypothetical protein
MKLTKMQAYTLAKTGLVLAALTVVTDIGLIVVSIYLIPPLLDAHLSQGFMDVVMIVLLMVCARWGLTALMFNRTKEVQEGLEPSILPEAEARRELFKMQKDITEREIQLWSVRASLYFAEENWDKDKWQQYQKHLHQLLPANLAREIEDRIQALSTVTL